MRIGVAKMILLIVLRTKINIVSGAVILLAAFTIAVLVVYVALTSFYEDVATKSATSVFQYEASESMEDF